MLKNPKFTHLHVHSHYSLLDGLSTVDGIIQHCVRHDMDSIALTDHGVMYGAIEFYKKAQAAGVKPIIGVEFYIAANGMHNKRSKIDEDRYHLTILAEDKAGYQNLVKLVTKAHLEGFYYKPRIDYDLLQEYSRGLICLSGCLKGEIPQAIAANQPERVSRLVQRLSAIFPRRFYLELQHHPSIPTQGKVNKALIELSKKHKLPVVATNDCHYLNPGDGEIQDILIAISTNKKLADSDRLSLAHTDLSAQPPVKMAEFFKNIPEAIHNSQEIAQRVNIDLELGKNYHLPHYKLPKGKSDMEWLEELARKGLRRRFKEKISSEYKKRFEYELRVIKKTGFASYFLIVQDFVGWAKRRGIVVGPGRGSAAGSLISYALDITNVDPLEYNLLFERFLNPDRVSMPDIDIDFTDIRRDEVIEYARKKYGQDRVAQIITFGTMAARVSIRDVGRVLSLPYSYCDKLAKLVPFGYKLNKVLQEVAEFRQIYDTDPQARRLVDVAQRLEGIVRHASTHACGVVITDESLDNFTPRQHASQDDKTIVTQYEMHSIEELGLLKMDFLGLRNLTTIERTLKIIEKTKRKKINIDEIPLDDKKTFGLLQRGETTGVFQLESSGMRSYLKQLVPNNIEDIIVMISLYRPGPLDVGMIPHYINRKHGREKIEYLHPKLEPILKKTYGIIVYQEQLLEVARQLAGFSYSEADLLRKAVGKKIKKLLDQQRSKLIRGMVNNGIKRSIAQRIWAFVEPFARYGFNRSHGTSYAMIAYQTAYLKANYPVEFMAALMSAEGRDIERIAVLVNETRSMGIDVLPPSINESMESFTVAGDKIRFGLATIKNVGENVVREIIKARKELGHFDSFEQFIKHINHKDLNKKSLEAMIKAGVFDELEDRATLLQNMEILLKASREYTDNKQRGQESLFGSLEQQQPETSWLNLVKASKAINESEVLAWEKELLGLYISSHPLKKYEDRLASQCVALSSIQNGGSGTVKVGGIVHEIKQITTRSGKPMLFVTLEDLTSRVECVVFPNTLEETAECWQEGRVIIAKARVQRTASDIKLICEDVQVFEEEQS